MGHVTSLAGFTAPFGVCQPIARVFENQDGNNDILRYILFNAKPSEQFSKKNKEKAKSKGEEYFDYYDFKKLIANRVSYGAIFTENKKKADSGSNVAQEVENVDTPAVPTPTEEEESKITGSKELDLDSGETVSEPGDDNDPDAEVPDSVSYDIEAYSETLTGLTGAVNFVHSKYMLLDVLSENPTVITGSANFSEPSTLQNDENMLVIQGDTSVADVYFTEFVRLFDHFYSRDQHKESKGADDDFGHVRDDDSWMKPYFDPSNQLCRERILLS